MQANPPQKPENVDNIGKVRVLTSQLREVLVGALRTAAQTIQANNLIDSGSLKATDTPIPRLDKAIEDFFVICDQIEYNLKTAMECNQQSQSSGRYLLMNVIPSRVEPLPQETNSVSYPQYLNTVRTQISYLKEIHDMLLSASQTIGSNE